MHIPSPVGNNIQRSFDASFLLSAVETMLLRALTRSDWALILRFLVKTQAIDDSTIAKIALLMLHGNFGQAFINSFNSLGEESVFVSV